MSSYENGNEVAYLEYFTPQSSDNHPKTYFIQVKSPVMSSSNVENTPEQEYVRIEANGTDLSTTPVRKIFPSRTYLEDSLNMSSSFNLTPDKESDFFSPSRSNNCLDFSKMDSGKRGRPRADIISNLIMEGSQSGSNIKCKICSRVFPREKSLQAHLRTHTGERPYNCDYPGCTRAFTQSGQLKTHQRLHAGEKPFVCSHPGCNNRYTHANRQCPDHPYAKPTRTSEIILQPNISASEDKNQVMAWLERYKRDRDERTPGKFNSHELTPSSESHYPEDGFPDVKRSRSKRGLELEMEQCLDQENFHSLNPSSLNSILNMSPPDLSNTSQRSSAAKQTLSAALQRAAENQAGHRLALQSIKSEEPSNLYSNLNSAGRLMIASPTKRLTIENPSPLKGIRRTLGDITPTKNCRTDQFHHDLELPFNFGIPTSPAFSSELLLRTPISSEKYIPSSPIIHGSPALKLKKRFQERFQEEKLIEREELAKPIMWQEDEFSTPVKRIMSSSPARRELSSPLSSYEFSSPSRETSSPTLLVAAALVELQDTSREDIPLNLTKYK